VTICPVCRPVGDLAGNGEGVSQRDGTLRDATGKGRPFDHFEHERVRGAAVLEAVNGCEC
jgi:hypothetical protein